MRFSSVVYTFGETYCVLNTKGAPDGNSQTNAVDTDHRKIIYRKYTEKKITVTDLAREFHVSRPDGAW